MFETAFATNFLIVWTLVRIRIIQEMFKSKAESQEMFISLSGLFDNFAIYKVFNAYWGQCSQALLGMAQLDQEPKLPSYLDPFCNIREELFVSKC